MNIKKNTVRCWCVLAVIFVVYNVIVFALPFHKTAVFMVSYLFTVIAIAAQIYVVKTAFFQGEDVKSKFYGFPIAKISAMYLVVQIVLGLIFMAMGAVAPVWFPLILYAVLFGVAAIGFISVDAVRDEIERQDVQIRKDVSCMRTLQSKAASMVQMTQDREVSKALEKFAEDLRFSDPVSSDALQNIEADLSTCLDEIQQSVLDGNKVGTLLLLKKAEVSLMERNRLCKVEKQRMP